MGRLILIPWHIGDAADLSLNVLRVAKRLRVFLAEEPEKTREQLESLFGVCSQGKKFLPIPQSYQQDFLDSALRLLEGEDVGLCSSGGVACFFDPGGWLVQEIRARGGGVVPLAGASSLSTLLSASGIEWGSESRCPGGTFIYYSASPQNEDRFLEVIRRKDEPVAVLTKVGDLPRCLGAIFRALGARPVTLFFDLATVPRSKYPYANEVLTRDCGQWLKNLDDFDWARVNNIALLIRPG